ncbi:carotenoid 1,2-hydratase [Wenzhouxiangella sp. XN79A]|uniref:lipocalin-like domain-containing protein n=1 Tax=Wenzhouxiangella sp. XN79A TaxID=2724193 RepID=UPI00144A7E41|nr:lipocalin-like domain-containing protein [Wenzhouxiangella sp. XN79A]NKI35683.1 carotenoid 1,2-hydratase [Wenzhouxiangella sp. XN79A]
MRRDLLIVMLLVALAATWLVLRSDPPEVVSGPLDTTALLAEAPEAFERITGPRPLDFPADHAAHPGYRSEWWYFTGNLFDRDGRRFGMQFTLFRFGLGTEASRPSLDSVFAADAVWMAHLAVSDIENRRFLNRERFARGALGLAGATADRWWLRDWTVTRTEAGWRLNADAGEFALDLALDAVKPVVLQGDRGYSQKGPAAGNASRYYTYSRLAADGRVRIDGRAYAVEGTAWLDREWGSSQLGPGIEGWDWFALQLDDGRDLMLYRLRTEAGEASPFSAGALVQSDGATTILGRDEFSLEPVRRWRDPDGVDWPVAWRARVPSAGLDLSIVPTFDDQQWRTGVRYWEGAIDVRASDSEIPLGRGYLELSGYSAASARGRR